MLVRARPERDPRGIPQPVGDNTLGVRIHRSHRRGVRVQRGDSALEPAARPVVRAGPIVHEGVQEPGLRHLRVEQDHVGGPGADVPANPQAVLGAERLRAAQHECRNFVAIEVLVRPEVLRHLKLRNVGELGRSVPRRRRAEHVRITQDESQGAVAGLTESERPPLRDFGRRRETVPEWNQIPDNETLQPA